MIAPLRRDLVTITGGDAASFLQGQLSQDVESLVVGDSALSLLLTPQGKVDAFGRLTRLDEAAFFFDVVGGHGDAVLARLSRFKLRVDVDLSLVGDVEGVAVRDEAAPVDAEARHTLPALWPSHDGVDLLGTSVEPTDDDEALTRRRIEAGVPELGAELDESTIPAEAGRWLIEATVNFAKGCYVGQELVARVDSRGSNTPRHLRRLRAPDGARIEAGAELQRDGAMVGRVTSASAELGLGYVGRAVDVPAELQAGGVTVSVTEL